MPKHLVDGKFSVILKALLETTKISPSTSKWALTRKEAINSIIRLAPVVGVNPDGNGKFTAKKSDFLIGILCILTKKFNFKVKRFFFI